MVGNDDSSRYSWLCPMRQCARVFIQWRKFSDTGSCLFFPWIKKFPPFECPDACCKSPTCLCTPCWACNSIRLNAFVPALRSCFWPCIMLYVYLRPLHILGKEQNRLAMQTFCMYSAQHMVGRYSSQKSYIAVLFCTIYLNSICRVIIPPKVIHDPKILTVCMNQAMRVAVSYITKRGC